MSYDFESYSKSVLKNLQLQLEYYNKRIDQYRQMYGDNIPPLRKAHLNRWIAQRNEIYTQLVNFKNQSHSSNELMDILQRHENMYEKLAKDRTIDRFNPYLNWGTDSSSLAAGLQRWVSKFFGDINIFENTYDLYLMWKNGTPLEEIQQIFNFRKNVTGMFSNASMFDNNEELIDKWEKGEVKSVSFKRPGRQKFKKIFDDTKPDYSETYSYIEKHIQHKKTGAKNINYGKIKTIRKKR